MSVQTTHLFNVCMGAARISSQIIRAVHESGNLEVESKSTVEFDPVTKADTEAQKAINGYVHSFIPGVCIIGEEDVVEKEYQETPAIPTEFSSFNGPFGSSLDISRIVLYVDPLDGSRAFVEGSLHEVTTLIGISYDGDAIGGIIGLPFSQEYVWGLVGHGISPLPRGEAELLEKAGKETRVVTSMSHKNPAMMTKVESLGANRVLFRGGCGYKSLLVIQKLVDYYCYPRNGTKKWDSCAPEGVLRAMGGTMVDCNGKRISYQRNDPIGNDQGILAVHTLSAADDAILKMSAP